MTPGFDRLGIAASQKGRSRPFHWSAWLNTGSDSGLKTRVPRTGQGRLRIRFLQWMLFGVMVLSTTVASAEATNTLAVPAPAPVVPDIGLSFLRVMGALAIVLALFLGGVWLFRNWQRVMIRGGRMPKLNVLEARSLGGRQSIYVVAYEQERFLLASSPNGVNFLSHLPASSETSSLPEGTAAAPSFAQALTQVLKGK